MVYLIHFDRSIGGDKSRARAQHYIGFTQEGKLMERMQEHASGQGAKIMAAVSLVYRVGWRVVRTWDGGRHLERQLKNKKGPSISALSAHARGKP
jgi:predicted GIY-YIG superfamily endonuclease